MQGRIRYGLALRSGPAYKQGCRPAAGYASAGAQAAFFRNQARPSQQDIVAWQYHAMNDNLPLAAYAS